MSPTCERCGSGSMRVYSTRVDKELGIRIRYRRCSECDTPQKYPELIPLQHAPIQISRVGRQGGDMRAAANA